MKHSIVRGAAVAVSLVLIAVTPAVSQASPASPAATTLLARYKLALDFRTHLHRNPFPGYTANVWSLRSSHSLKPDGNYRLLPSYSRTFGSSGIQAWHGNSRSSCVQVPAIGVNTASTTRPLCSGKVPAGAAFARPSSNQLAVVAWTSPFDGTVVISHDSISDLDGACGDGVGYTVWFDKALLSSLQLPNKGGTDMAPITETIKKGQSFYFIVDPGPSHNSGCDTTQLQITIDDVSTS